ncbi:adenylate kinase [Amycolatopsis cynarae]|uniref:Adenylate kinase n=2 Tax=Amycolatopsis TaxID=1813 RepID=A0A558D797_9PSEU|nr:MULTISPECIES: adenylate kinase [Amycolatopsis]TVT56904.1 adenylate kinase [Amycolatopsis rhizosphaerae]WAL65131.1 adenylate kinase [Amycolatopsis sp. HUAS 11-8]
MTRLVLVGPPGAGKGTQAEALSQKLSVPHISTGELFRAHVAERTPLGEEAKRYLDSGELVPDTVTNEMVRERLAEADAKAGFLLDGFPRNAKQAEVLGNMLAEVDTALDAVIQLDVPEDVVVERLMSRGRSDDTEEVIRRRQQVYQSDTAPLLEYYKDILIKVDGVGDVEEVSARVLNALRDRH